MDRDKDSDKNNQNIDNNIESSDKNNENINNNEQKPDNNIENSDKNNNNNIGNSDKNNNNNLENNDKNNENMNNNEQKNNNNNIINTDKNNENINNNEQKSDYNVENSDNNNQNLNNNIEKTDKNNQNIDNQNINTNNQNRNNNEQNSDNNVENNDKNNENINNNEQKNNENNIENSDKNNEHNIENSHKINNNNIENSDKINNNNIENSDKNNNNNIENNDKNNNNNLENNDKNNQNLNVNVENFVKNNQNLNINNPNMIKKNNDEISEIKTQSNTINIENNHDDKTLMMNEQINKKNEEGNKKEDENQLNNKKSDLTSLKNLSENKKLFFELIKEYINKSYNNILKIIDYYKSNCIYEKQDYLLIFKIIWEILQTKPNNIIMKNCIKIILMFLNFENIFLTSKEKLIINLFNEEFKGIKDNYIIQLKLINEKENNEIERLINIKTEDKFYKAIIFASKDIKEEKEKQDLNNKYLIKEKNKTINIDIRFISKTNNMELFINNELIDTINNEKITIEIDLNSQYKLTPILLYQTNDELKNPSIVEEKKNMILTISEENKNVIKNQQNLTDNITRENKENKTQNQNLKNLNIQLWKTNNSIEKKTNISINLIDLKTEEILSNIIQFIGSKSFLPIFELISDTQEIFEELSDIILNHIKVNYANFLEAYYSNFYKGYNYFGKKYYSKTKNPNVKILLITSEIFIREEIINDIINSKIYDKNYYFYSTDIDRYLYEIFPYFYDLILLYSIDNNGSVDYIFNYILQFMNENHPINDMDNIIKKINNVLENNFPNFYTPLQNFEIYKNTFWQKREILNWFRSSSNKKCEFIENENKKFDLFYTCFKFCDMLFINGKNNDIEHKILTYIIINLKIGFNKTIVSKSKSIFYHNTNFLILLLNHTPLVKNKDIRPLIVIIELLKSILYKSSNNEYFDINKRFITYSDELKSKEIDYPQETIKFIEEVIIPYKYCELNVNFGIHLNNLKIYRDIKKELFSWNSTYANLNLFYPNYSKEIKNEENKEKNKLEHKIIYKRCFHLTKDMTLPLLEPIIDFKYYESNFSQKDKFNVIRDNKNDDNINLNIIDHEIGQNENLIKCCVCKTNYHITGHLIQSKSYIEFYAKVNIFKKKCLGSLGIFGKNTKDYTYYLHLNYEQTNFILKRKYYFEDNALEFYYDNNKSYFLIFENTETRDGVLNKITKNFEPINLNPNKKSMDGKYHINYFKQFIDNNSQNEIKEFNFKKFHDLWKKHRISTLQYLMWANIFGSRSYRDLTQYPVFPWIITNYVQDKRILKLKVEIEKNEEFIIKQLFDKYIRDLNIPMGMMEINDKSIRRKSCYIETYTDLIKELNKNHCKNKGQPISKKIPNSICKILEIDDIDEKKNVVEILKKEPVISSNINTKIPLKQPNINQEKKKEEVKKDEIKKEEEKNQEEKKDEKTDKEVKKEEIKEEEKKVQNVENNKSQEVKNEKVEKPSTNENKLEKREQKEFNDFSINLDYWKIYSNPKIPIDSIPYFFGSHFSNPAYVCYYLSRVFPFSFAAVEIQGNNFGAADRLFMNLERSFTSSSTEKSDVRELIPELFYLPNLFQNFNNLNYGSLQDKSKNPNATSKILREIHQVPPSDKIFVNEVLTGFWNENNPNYFVLIHRRILENKNLKINDWINLIFGIYSNGENAKEKINLFMPYCYDNVVSCRLNEIEKGMRLSYLKLFELGVNPKQISFQDLESRIDIKNCPNFKQINIPFDDDNNKINYKYFNFTHSYFDISKKEIIDEKAIQNFKILDKVYTYKINDFQYKNEISQSKITFCTNYKASIKKSFYILGLEDGITLIYYTLHDYNFTENVKKFYLYKILNNHSKKINFIHSNDNLNMFIDCSNDDYVHLYTLPNVKLIHSKKIPNVKFVLLTSSPLPGFLVITNNDIFMFNINGELVCKINNTLNIKQPIIIHDEEFNDYLYDVQSVEEKEIKNKNNEEQENKNKNEGKEEKEEKVENEQVEKDKKNVEKENKNENKKKENDNIKNNQSHLFIKLPLLQIYNVKIENKK